MPSGTKKVGPEDKDLDYYFRANQTLEEREAASSTANEPTLQPPSMLKPVEGDT